VLRVESEVKKAPSALRKRCDVIKSEHADAVLDCCVVNKASGDLGWRVYVYEDKVYRASSKSAWPLDLASNCADM
jgi:hypothetical protein